MSYKYSNEQSSHVPPSSCRARVEDNSEIQCTYAAAGGCVVLSRSTITVRYNALTQLQAAVLS